MITELKQFLAQFSFLSASDVAEIFKATTVLRINKGEHLVKTGDVSFQICLVLRGFMRVYIVRSDGEERTVYLAGRGMPIGSSKTLFAGGPSNENLVALENSILIQADIRDFKRLCEKNPKLYKFYAQMMERSMIEAIERIEFHSVLNPDQRYEYLLQHRPEIIRRVPLKHIASYIGITPVSLSRLRARIAKGNGV